VQSGDGRGLRAPRRSAPLWDVDDAAVRAKWRSASAGAHYASERFASARRRRRDGRLVAALLERHLARGARERILDAPCGTGRLRAALAPFGRYAGIDVSPAMLAQAGLGGARGALLLGDVERLPFPDSSFDAVVCCRLLHHLRERASLERVLAELVRVSRGLVVASFWDARSLGTWRRALLPGPRPPARFARPRAELALALDRAGADVIAWRHSLRFVSRQAFVLARKRARP